MLNVRHQLREASAEAHRRVDAAYSGFDLGNRHAYASFLHAHARALPRLENALSSLRAAWRRRSALLLQDLSEMGCSAPVSTPLPREDGARGWGMLYVLEGSRFGGAVLSRQIGENLPRRYLGDAHAPGEWRNFEHALQSAADSGGAAWLGEAVKGATLAFDLFEQAAEQELVRA